MKNKKMLFIIMSVLIVIILGGVLAVALLNKESQKAKQADDLIVLSYFAFLDGEADRLPDIQVASLYDIDFNGTEELLLYKSEGDMNHITIYTIDGNGVREVQKIETHSMLHLDYSEKEDRYYYTYLNKNQEKYVIKSLDNFEKANEEYKGVTLEAEAFKKGNLYESFSNFCTICRETVKDYDFTKTYEITKTQIDKETTSNITTPSEQGQNLCDVAKVGDYVNYMGSDKDWRIIYLYHDSNGEEKTAYLIYSSYLEDGFDPKDSYESLMYYLQRKDIFTNYLDESVASAVITSVNCTYFDSAVQTYYNTIPDLFDVGVDYNLSGEIHINYFTSKLGYYKNGSGEVTGVYGWSKKIRPSVILKTNVTTTGKNANGAWVLSGATEKSSTQTENTEVTPITEEPKNTFNESYLGDYNWEKGNDRISFELQKGKGRTDFYLLYYPNGYTSPAEEIWGEWTGETNIDSVNNENDDAFATYSFKDIKYNGNSIEITINTKKINNSQFANERIPDGTYKFIKK